MRPCLRCRAATAQVKAENLEVVEKPFESIRPGFLSESLPVVLGVPDPASTISTLSSSIGTLIATIGTLIATIGTLIATIGTLIETIGTDHRRLSLPLRCRPPARDRLLLRQTALGRRRREVVRRAAGSVVAVPRA